MFSTSEALVSEDTDAVTDIYVRQGGTVERLSVGPEGGNAANGAAVFKGASRDADAVIFTTHEKLTADDNRTSCRTFDPFGPAFAPCSDIYGRINGTTVNVSGPVVGDGGAPGFVGISRDGGGLLRHDRSPVTGVGRLVRRGLRGRHDRMRGHLRVPERGAARSSQ